MDTKCAICQHEYNSTPLASSTRCPKCGHVYIYGEYNITCKTCGRGTITTDPEETRCNACLDDAYYDGDYDVSRDHYGEQHK